MPQLPHPFRPARFAALVLLAALVALAAVFASSAQAAPSRLQAKPAFKALSAAKGREASIKARRSSVRVRHIKATRTSGRRATFRLKQLRKARIRRAELRTRSQRLKISRKALRRVVKAGKTQVQIQAPVKLSPAPAAAKPVLVVEVAPAKPAVKPVTQQPKPQAGTPAPPAVAFGGRPGADWRPYSDSSPFNQPVGASPRLAPNSAQLVGHILSRGNGDSISTTDGSAASADQDWSRPIVWATESDPVFKVKCVEYGGQCPILGDEVHIPDAARAAGGSDGHLTVVQPDRRTEYSFFQVRSKPVGGGELVVSWGDKATLDGTGTHAGGGAARFGGLAGRIRWEEFADAIQRRTGLRHALFMVVNCSKPGAFVYPAAKDEDKQNCADTTNAPEMGRRFWLDMTPEEIDALQVPEWRKVIARTLATYGAYVGDQGAGSFGFQFESAQSFLPFGQENPFATYARTNSDGIATGPGVYYYKMRDGIPWSSRLKAVEPPPVA